MVWQAIANGANGIVFYSYFDIQRNADVPFDVQWGRLLDVATEVKLFAPIVLSDEGGALAPLASIVVGAAERPTAAARGGGGAVATATATPSWLHMRARWTSSTATAGAEVAPPPCVPGTATRPANASAAGVSFVGGCEYVVFVVADGSGAGDVTFTLPAAAGFGQIKSVTTCASPFNGGTPSRQLPVSAGRDQWTDTVQDMEMVAYRLVFL
jgi:hypothetical protein